MLKKPQSKMNIFNTEVTGQESGKKNQENREKLVLQNWIFQTFAPRQMQNNPRFRSPGTFMGQRQNANQN